VACSQADLQARIAAAGVGGTVVLDGTCVYVLNSANFTSSSTGNSGVAVFNAAVVEGNGAIIERASNAPAFRVMYLNRTSGTLTVRNLTVRGGLTSGTDPAKSSSYGGGLMLAGSVVLENVNVTNNVANAGGGGIFVSGSSTQINGGSVRNNRATIDGGGIYAYQPLTANNLEITGNTGVRGGGVYAENASFFGGSISNNTGQDGGGVYAFTSLTLNGLTLNGNSASRGGGVYVHSAATLASAIFSSNSAGTGGGAYVEGNAQVTDTQFLSNWANAGGGFYNVGTATVSNGLVQNNTAFNGAGFFSGGTLTFTGTQIDGNTAYTSGGGGQNTGTLTLNNPTFSNNRATQGNGGALVSSTNFTLNRGKFLGNSALAGRGGALWSNAAQITLNNGLFARNTSLSGGAAVHMATVGSQLNVRHVTLADTVPNPNPAVLVFGNLDMRNSIVANHAVAIGAASGTGATVSENYNLFANVGNIGSVMKPGTTISLGANSVTFPEAFFINPSVDNFRLQATSPALNRGTNLSLNTDLDGNPRPFASTGIDLGAYEYQAVSTPKLTIIKTGPPWLAAGKPVPFMLTVFNATGSTVSDVVVTETLPAGATLVAGSISNSGTFSAGTVTWNLSLAAGRTAQLRYEVTAVQTLVSNAYSATSQSNGSLFASGPTLTTPLNGSITAMSNFAPRSDGYNFANYIDSPQTDLTINDLVTIFGASNVCKTQSPCVLTAAAEEWRQLMLKNMELGHAAGMAQTSLWFFAGNGNPNTYQGGAVSPFELSKNNIRRLVALNTVVRAFAPNNTSGAAPVAADGLAAALPLLATNLNNNSATDRYVLLLSNAGGDKGLAVVPYALEQKSASEVWVYVYDGNFPNDFTRVVKANTTAGTWRYETTTTPVGGASTLASGPNARFRLLSRVWAERFPKNCATLPNGNSAPGPCRPASLSATETLEFQFAGEGYFIITRSDGLAAGFDALTGAFTSNLPGAEPVDYAQGFGLNHVPAIRLPHQTGTQYTVQVVSRGTALGNSESTAEFNILGPGYMVRLTNLQLDANVFPFESYTVTFDPVTKRLTFRNSNADGETPNARLVFTRPGGNDYEIEVKPNGLEGGFSFLAMFNETTGLLTLENNDGNESNVWNVTVRRTNSGGTLHTFTSTSVTDGTCDGALIDVGVNWNGTAQPNIQNNCTVTLPWPFAIYLPVVRK
jgi:uncharacterized repeat protein (TIGR01451 family)